MPANAKMDESLRELLEDVRPDQIPPAEFIIPRRIVVSRESFEMLLSRARITEPPPALVALMSGAGEDIPGL